MTVELASRADLARRWAISPQRIYQLSKLPGFPKPAMKVDGGRRALYSVVEADRWRAGRPKNGRPRKAA